MNAFSVSILLSAGSVRVTSTSSFSSSGLAGVAVFRSVTGARLVRVELAATSLAIVGEAFAAGLSVISGDVLGDGTGTTRDGVASGAVSEGCAWGDADASGVADGCGDSTTGATVAV